MPAGSIVDMKELGVWEPLAVKSQTIKTAVESATLLLRIDDIVSGMSKREKPAPGQAKGPQAEDPDQVLFLPPNFFFVFTVFFICEKSGHSNPPYLSLLEVIVSCLF